MGHIQHDAIVVTSWDVDSVKAAHARATELGCVTSSIVGPVTNGYTSFMVAPDGSKEFWDESDEHDRKRAELLAWMREQNRLEWIAVRFGEDPAQIVGGG